MPKTIRDTIHGDIDLDDFAVSVVDTREFQRLRYIRQTGLLHFVFPGANHTRFTHSLGAHWISRKVSNRLLGPLLQTLTTSDWVGYRKHLEYLSLAFTAAALLHDVGHMAFSHSSEHVEIKGKSLLGTVRDLLEAWEPTDSSFRTEYTQALGERTPDSPGSHEDLSILFIRRILAQAGPGKACKNLGVNAQDLAKDVCALIHGNLPVSSSFREGSIALGLALLEREESLGKKVIFEDPLGVRDQLHGLISGTLDVDRLDYLIRDSIHAGVSYGKLDVDFLIRNLTFKLVEGRPQILLKHKALFALDDMLWSRYQLFIQVLNHKTNVGLDAVLGKVIAEAVQKKVLSVPRTPDDFITFTDDHVMSRLSQAVVSGKLKDSEYGRILVDRVVPRHIKSYDQEFPPDVLKSYLTTLAKQESVEESRILNWRVSATLLKPQSAMPWLLKGDYMDRYTLSKSSLKGIQPKYTITHFFCVPVEPQSGVAKKKPIVNASSRKKLKARTRKEPS